MSRRIAVFTSSRGDLGPLGPVVAALDREPRIELVVIATGTHVTEAYGGRLADIRLSDESRLRVLEAEIAGTAPADLGSAYAEISAGVSGVLSEGGFDVLVLLGDRWELLAAAGVALIHGVPIAHLHGGETTEGAIDERIRHGITKLADLHLCATEDSARRIRHLGEEPWRIVVTGAPGLDRIAAVEPASHDRLRELLGREVERPFGVVVYHPPTVDRSALADRARAVYDAAAGELATVLALYPGADPGSDEVIEELGRASARHANLVVHRNLGEAYLPVLAAADVLIGNSSSGIIEAASLRLPVVDVGDRQRGRLRPRNVVHVGEGRAEVAGGVRRALADTFRGGLADLINPYGDGTAAGQIMTALLDAPLDRLLRKPLVEAEDRGVGLDDVTVKPGASLRQAMETIGRGGCQIAFVVDGEERLLGCLTDGDVRRALLGGQTLDDPLDDHVNRLPTVARPEDDASHVLAAMERNGVTQVPVVDDQGRLVGLHLMTAIVGRTLDSSALRVGVEDAV